MALDSRGIPISQPKILSVSQLTAAIKDVLETAIPSVWVAGEVSDCSRPQSGHIYFTLKDDRSQIRAVIWRKSASRLKFELQDGMEIVCCGVLDVYLPRGSYQLNVQDVEPVGLGARQLAFKQLHAKLAAEGLFDPARKRPLPRFPHYIAIVTSPTGAAIRDFLEVLRRRWRGIHVLILPSRVQGEGAGLEIANRIKLTGRLDPAPDVIVVARGGGSIDDLWSFNEEMVVRAIAGSKIPVVSAVGHEIDVTLADLAADVRALTPTEAAERVVPSQEDVLATMAAFQRRLVASLRSRAMQMRSRVDSIAQRRVFRRPFDIVHDAVRRVDELSVQANRAIQAALQSNRDRMQSVAGRLEALSPLAVLQRGYSLTELANNGEILTDADQVQVGDRIVTRLSRGTIYSVADDVERKE